MSIDPSASAPIFDSHVHYWEPPTSERPHSAAGIVIGPPVSVEALVEAARSAGVDRIIQVTPSCMGFDNRYSLEGAERFPDRVRVFGRVDPTGADMIDRVDEWREHRLAAGVRLTPLVDRREWAANPDWTPFWQRCEELALPTAVYAPNQARELAALAQAHPGLILLVDHCALPHANATFEDWDEVLDLARLANVTMKVSHFPESAVDEGYPFPSGQRRLREIYEHFGADRMIWGSNFPPVLNACSYAQAVSFVRDECDFFTDDDRAKVLGGTLARLLNDSAPASA